MMAAWFEAWVDWNALGVLVNLALGAFVAVLAYYSLKSGQAMQRLEEREAARNAPQLILAEVDILDDPSHFRLDVLNLGRDSVVITETAWQDDRRTGHEVAEHYRDRAMTDAQGEGPLVVPGRGHVRYYVRFGSIQRQVENGHESSVRGMLVVKGTDKTRVSYRISMDLDDERRVTSVFMTA